MQAQHSLEHRPRRHGAPASWARVFRQRILDAAEKRLKNQSLSELTCTELASALGVRPVSLFKHFRDIEDIRDNLSLRALEQLTELLRSSIAGWAGSRALATLVNMQRLYAQDRPGMYAAALRGQSSSSPELAEAFVAFTRIETSALGAYCMAADDAAGLAWCLRAAIRGAIELEAADRGANPHVVDGHFERLVDVFDDAARAAGAHSPGSPSRRRFSEAASL
jgi:AcrR family transcriptional regulator